MKLELHTPVIASGGKRNQCVEVSVQTMIFRYAIRVWPNGNWQRIRDYTILSSDEIRTRWTGIGASYIDKVFDKLRLDMQNYARAGGEHVLGRLRHEVNSFNETSPVQRGENHAKATRPAVAHAGFGTTFQLPFFRPHVPQRRRPESGQLAGARRTTKA